MGKDFCCNFFLFSEHLILMPRLETQAYQLLEGEKGSGEGRTRRKAGEKAGEGEGGRRNEEKMEEVLRRRRWERE